MFGLIGGLPMAVDDDIVEDILEVEKPGDVADFWDKQVKPNKDQWSHPLSEIEKGYIDAFRGPATPKELRMRIPVDPKNLTPEEREQCNNLFNGAADRYANYENRGRILAHYVYTHPATVRLEMGLYRLFRDVNPVFFALEKGWEIGSGKEMFTNEDVSRLGAALEFTISLAVVYGVGKMFELANPAADANPPRPVRALTDPIYDLPRKAGG